MNVNDIIKGPFFPEAIEVKNVESFGEEYLLLEGIGCQTNQYYERLFTQDELQSIVVVSSAEGAEHQLTGQSVQNRFLHLMLKLEEKQSQKMMRGNQQIIPLPHQIEAVYKKMLQSPNVRYLLADDPGAGKTIMSGMLIKELKARESIKRVLILVPPIVLVQWQEELEQKFQESFKIINRATLGEYGNTNPFIENDCCLVSMYWASREDIKHLILEASFDLVIVDEAHKMAAYTYGKVKPKTNKTKLYNLGESLLSKSENCLLLTATPHKGNAENYRLLMKLIDSDLFNHLLPEETLRDKSNPYIIRRLKESMVNFDGTPIFAKRTTKTVLYTLSDEEMELYDAVTDYVRQHFNRAINSGKNSTAFAMMLLQRRMSSSVEAIHKSLIRRKGRLTELLSDTEERRKKYADQVENYYQDSLNEEVDNAEDTLDHELELSIDEIDIDALNDEIDELEHLINVTVELKQYGIEKKYIELEQMLFGVGGLVYTGEKILIFTESVDTLNFLSEKLSERVSPIAKIVGSYSMDERRKQVELFKTTAQIMLATDAGGESINLQFCNQMINYDIPWNPNRLEQRMGRIHRIGQKNEVFVFNLVANGTREGYVMSKLLEKLETMKLDLGNDLVYNFMGELLDGEQTLADLMRDAILHRENLEEIVSKMDRSISDEHKKLLKSMQELQLNEDTLDVGKLKQEQYEVEINTISNRLLVPYINYAFNKNNVKVFHAQNDRFHRVDRFPKMIRDKYARQLKLDGSYHYTRFSDYKNEEITLIDSEHPLVTLANQLLESNNDFAAFKKYLLIYAVPEKLELSVYQVKLQDGTGKELQNKLIILGERQDGSILGISPYWLALDRFPDSITEMPITDDHIFKKEVLQSSLEEKRHLEIMRSNQLNKLHDYLINSFESQYNDIYEKLVQYQLNNIDNRNSILINQMNSQLIDVEIQKQSRIELLNRQRTITMMPPKKIAQFELIPNGSSMRVIAEDYIELVVQYEKANGRKIVKTFDNLSLVDFYSERYNGEERFIILTNHTNYVFSEEYIEDLKSIADKTYVYSISDEGIIENKLL